MIPGDSSRDYGFAAKDAQNSSLPNEAASDLHRQPRSCSYGLYGTNLHNRTASSIPALARDRASAEKARAEMPLR